MGDVAEGKGIARYAVQDDHSRSGSPELCDTQTANTHKQSQGVASVSSSIDAEHENSATVPKLEREPEKSQTVNGATTARSVMDTLIDEEQAFAQEGATLSLKTLSSKVSIRCSVRRT